jgi:hypothetical protein
MDKQRIPNGARDRMVTVKDGDLLEELVSAATVEEVKVIEAKARAAREVIASIGEQLQPFAPAASALAQAFQEQGQCNGRLQEAAQRNEHELRLRAAQDSENERVRQCRTQARFQIIGTGVFAFIVLVCVVLAGLVHAGVLDRTSALLVGAFFPVLWSAIKNVAK